MADATIEKSFDLAEQERVHQSKINENYRKLLEGAAPEAPVHEARPQTSLDEYFQKARVANGAPAPSADAAARIADYAAPPAPAKKKILFEDLTYAGQDVVYRTPVAAPAPQAAAVVAPAAPAPVQTDEEDALPTRRTMDTLHRPAARTEESVQAKKVGFFSALSAKTKVVLAVVAVAIVAVIAVIGVNTGIINSLRRGVTEKQAEIERLQQQQEGLQGEIDELLDSDNVAQWAQEHGMVREG